MVSPQDRAAYDAEVERLGAAIPEVGPERRWYLMLGDDVVGPVRWGETLESDPSGAGNWQG